MNAKNVAKLLAKLGMLKFFPADAEARTGILEIVCQMASSEAQVEWLVNRMLSAYNEWPGPREMRACFCCRFRPADGVNAYSEKFGGDLEPWPPDPTVPRQQIGGAKMPALPQGMPESDDSRIAEAIQEAREVVGRRGVLGGPATATEIAAAPKWLRELEGYEK
jgi:hypothetical protein